MPDQFTIYQQYADRYDELVAYEDYQQQLPQALISIRSFDQADVIEWGAGTGRLSALIAPHARSLIACDLNPHMLKTARPKLARCSDLRWQTIVTEHRRMPLLDGCADVSLAGWTLGYFNSRYCGAVWKQALQQALGEMRRVLRPGGTIIIIETLGTGATEPTPPHEDLAAYYHWLEDELGFQSKWIRTDYQFDSLDQSAELTGFFFGEEWAEKVRRNNWIILPECTGIWWKNVG